MAANESALPPHILGCDQAGTLPELFRRRVERTPQAVAYRQYEHGAWRDYRWVEVARLVGRWTAGLAGEGLAPGERVALAVPNGLEWVCFDQAALALGLVPVPIYTTDSAANMVHILGDCGARLLLLESDRQWQQLAEAGASRAGLKRVLCLARQTGTADPAIRYLGDWLPAEPRAREERAADPNGLATIVYTSGTTGPSKGVMQSHRGILWTAEAVLRRSPAWPSDRFLSFLPLAHSFERTVGYYLATMAGAQVCFARSVDLLREDLESQRPTLLLAVPRVYDKVYLAVQGRLGERGPRRWLFDATVRLGWRRFQAAAGRGPAPRMPERLLERLLHRWVARKVTDRLGGRLRVAVSGGAPLSPTVARFFMGLGLPLTEGYGLTEASPVLTNSSPQDCIPGYVGKPLPGVALRIGPDEEVLARTPGAMLGYWGQPEATAAAVDGDGWLHTGDRGELRDGYLRIRGRLKEILVTSTGQKVPPGEMEQAILMDPLFAQAMVIGEGRPYLAALVVLEPAAWATLARGLGLDPTDPSALRHAAAVGAVLSRARGRLKSFPGYAQVRAVHLALEPWTVGSGLLTPTLKVRRERLEARFAHAIRGLYGPQVPWDGR